MSDIDLNDFFYTPMTDDEVQQALDDARRYVIVYSRQHGGIVPPVVAILSEVTSAVKHLQNQLEKEQYEHGRTAEQRSKFAGRLGRINRMLDEAGVESDGSADERLAKMLNRELPQYP